MKASHSIFGHVSSLLRFEVLKLVANLKFSDLEFVVFIVKTNWCEPE